LVAVRARLILLKLEQNTWAREGETLTFDDDESEAGEKKAEDRGREWVRQDPARRDYSVLRRKPSPETPRRLDS